MLDTQGYALLSPVVDEMPEVHDRGHEAAAPLTPTVSAGDCDAPAKNIFRSGACYKVTHLVTIGPEPGEGNDGC